MLFLLSYYITEEIVLDIRVADKIERNCCEFVDHNLDDKNSYIVIEANK